MRPVASLVALLAAAALLAGCTAAPAPTLEVAPEPTPTAEAPATEPSWDADIAVTREFPDADGTLVECTIYKRAVAASENASDELRAQVEAARSHLVASDWSATEVSLDGVPTDELDARRAQGLGDPGLYAMVLSDLITEDLSAQGLTQPGVSLEGYVNCG